MQWKNWDSKLNSIYSFTIIDTFTSDQLGKVCTEWTEYCNWESESEKNKLETLYKNNDNF